MPRDEYKIPAGWLAVLCCCCVVLGYLMACWDIEASKAMTLEEYAAIRREIEEGKK